MSDSAVGIANRFRKLFGFEQIEAHPAVEHHHHPYHAKLVPIESIATTPTLGDGEMHILSFAREGLEEGLYLGLDVIDGVG